MVTEKEVVLIYVEDTPVSFARVERIKPDARKDWFHIRLLMLQIPLQAVTWILKDDYINGGEFFMGGKKMRFEKVASPQETGMPAEAPFRDGTDTGEDRPASQKGEAEIISFADVKKSKDRDDPK